MSSATNTTYGAKNKPLNGVTSQQIVRWIKIQQQGIGCPEYLEWMESQIKWQLSDDFPWDE